MSHEFLPPWDFSLVLETMNSRFLGPRSLGFKDLSSYSKVWSLFQGPANHLLQVVDHQKPNKTEGKAFGVRFLHPFVIKLNISEKKGTIN